MSDTAETPQEQIIIGRREKHEAILAAGGYPHRFQRTHMAADIAGAYSDLEPGVETPDRVAVAGRLMLKRSFGKLQFGTLSDVSGTVQLFVETNTAGEENASLFAELDLGDWVGASGVVMTTKRGELSVKLDELTLLQKSFRPLPDKYHGLTDIEARSRRRYLDLMVNDEARSVAVTRTKVIAELRRQFASRGFLEVETPVLLGQATGALARSFETHHNALDMGMHLRIATELYLKRLVIGGMERVFEIGRIFRNEGVDATHNPEFTMLEAYQAFADYSDIMDLIEEVFQAVAIAATDGTEVTYQDRGLSFATPFEKITLTKLVSRWLGEEVSIDTDSEILRQHLLSRGGEASETASAPRLLFDLYEQAHKQVWQPTFVTDFPTEISPLSRSRPDDPRLTERFELVIAGAEYCNAFSELNDPDEQRARFEAQASRKVAGDDEAHPIDEDYLLALEFGLPPTGGLGIGVDRLVMLLTDQAHIREVILFPTLRPEQT